MQVLNKIINVYWEIRGDRISHKVVAGLEIHVKCLACSLIYNNYYYTLSHFFVELLSYNLIVIILRYKQILYIKISTLFLSLGVPVKSLLK